MVSSILFLLFPIIAASSYASSISSISISTSPPCPPPLSTCALSCYNTTTHKCCPGVYNLCLIDQVCAQAETPNGNITNGCCPHGSSTCGDWCFDAVALKCCTGRGGKYGLCPWGTDCCGELCCAVGEVYVAGSGGMMCWPKGGAKDVVGEEDHGTGVGIGASEAKSSGGRKLVLPMFLPLIFLSLLVPLTASSFTINTIALDQSSHSESPSITQSLPSYTSHAKRWSCHGTKEPCGLGCFNPADSTCCGAGMCPRGMVCCGQYCCPGGTTCKQELAMNWCVSKPNVVSKQDLNDTLRHQKDENGKGEIHDAAIANEMEGFDGDGEDVRTSGWKEKHGGGHGSGGRGGHGGHRSDTSSVATEHLKGALYLVPLVVVYSLLSRL